MSAGWAALKSCGRATCCASKNKLKQKLPALTSRQHKRRSARKRASGADELELRGGTYVPSMHRKHSSNGRPSRIHGRNSGRMHRQVQKILDEAAPSGHPREWARAEDSIKKSESSRSVSENKGDGMN